MEGGVFVANLEKKCRGVTKGFLFPGIGFNQWISIISMEPNEYYYFGGGPSMKLKTVLMAAVLAATVGMTGLHQASAEEAAAQGGNSRHHHKMDDATKAKFVKFREDNKDLFKQIVMKKAEVSALVRSETPNIEAVKKSAGDLFDLKASLKDKAKAADLFADMHKDGKDAKKEEMRAKFQKFFADTKDLRRQIAVKKAEKRAVMHGKTPDPMAAAKVSGEVFDLKSSLHEKAVAAGLPHHFHGKHHHKRAHHHGMKG